MLKVARTMPNFTTSQIFSLTQSLEQLEKLLNDENPSSQHPLVQALDKTNKSILSLRELMLSEAGREPHHLTEQLCEFYNNHFLPFLEKNMSIVADQGRSGDLQKNGVRYYFYKTLSCITGLMADAASIDATTTTKQWQTNYDASEKAARAILAHKYNAVLDSWSCEYFLAMQDDMTYLSGMDNTSKKTYTKFAAIRQAMHVLLLDPNEANANSLLAAVANSINNKVISDLWKRQTNWSDYRKLVTLMHQCMTSLPAGPIHDKMNNAYAELLLNIIRRGQNDKGMLLSELAFTLTQSSTLSTGTTLDAKQLLEQYKDKRTNLAKEMSRTYAVTEADSFTRENAAFNQIHAVLNPPPAATTSLRN